MEIREQKHLEHLSDHVLEDYRNRREKVIEAIEERINKAVVKSWPI